MVVGCGVEEGGDGRMTTDCRGRSITSTLFEYIYKTVVVVVVVVVITSEEEDDSHSKEQRQRL